MGVFEQKQWISGRGFLSAARRKWLAWWEPAFITLIYLLAGWAWIGLSDWWAYRHVAPDMEATLFQTVKGAVFVGVTGACLLILLTWRQRRQALTDRRLELVVSQLPGFLWTTDTRLRLQSIVGQDLAGFPIRPEKLIGRTVGELMEGSERRAVVETGHRRALAGESADYELDVNGMDLVVRVEPLRSPSGKLVGCVGFGLDISNLRMKDSTLGVRDALRRSQVLASLGTLVLDVAHKIKNPLFALTAALDAFEHRTGDHPDTEPHRKIMRQQVERILAIVNGLQEYGTVKALEIRTCDLTRLLRRVEQELSGAAAARNVELRIEPPKDEVLETSLDPDAFQSALARVVKNSIQHAPHGGIVKISARRSPHERARLEVIVEDNGPGFLPQDISRASEPLFSRRTDGAGLGLSIAERIVQLHGGRLELGPSDSGGAQVRILLNPPEP